MSDAIRLNSPPKAPLAFRVGIVGHRPDRLTHADLPMLAVVMRGLLTTIALEVRAFQSSHPNLYDETPPVMRAVSPLAEGSDRVFATEAIGLGYELTCPWPFPQQEFERDFEVGRSLEADSLQAFRALLARAAKETALVRFQLDGDRADEPTAYGNGGRVVLNQSDILVVVWDGVRLGKRGGTESTFNEALSRGVPVVWVDAHAPHRWQVLERLPAPDAARATPSTTSNPKELGSLVHSLLDLPSVESGSGLAALLRFYAERKPAANPMALWRTFRSLFGAANWTWPELTVADFEAAVRDEFPSDKSSASARVVNQLRPYYAWPDQLAVYYSNAYRGAFVLAYGLAALAVGLALVPVAAGPLGWWTHGKETASAVAEMVAILGIIILIWRGRKREWHERWIDYRMGAELVRHLRMASLLGGERPFPQLAAHFAKYGQPGATWVSWYVRAVERHCGVPDNVVDGDYLVRSVRELRTLIEGQLRYHQSTAAQCHLTEHRLHRLGLTLLGGTLLAAGLHIAGSFVPGLHSPGASGILIALGAFLPALGASLAGINNQGEFRRIAKRSEAMAEHLKKLLAEAGALTPADGSPVTLRWTAVADLTARVTQLMVNEVLDWRVVFLDRPLNPPS